MPQGKKTRVNKMEAVRQAIDQHGKDIKPGEIVEFVRSKFGAGMSDAMASNYKSTILRKGVRKKRKLAAVPATTRNHGISLADIQEVKALVDRIGAEKVRQLAELLAK